MAHLFNNNTNFSLYTIPAAWIIAFVPHAYAASKSKSFDNRSPRTYTQSQSLKDDITIDNATKSRIHRAEAAQANGFENLPLFATSILAGNLAPLPTPTLNTLAVTYLTSRVLYNYIYINNTTQTQAGLRSVVFLAGVGQCFALFFMAGSVLWRG